MKYIYIYAGYLSVQGHMPGMEVTSPPAEWRASRVPGMARDGRRLEMAILTLPALPVVEANTLRTFAVCRASE